MIIFFMIITQITLGSYVPLQIMFKLYFSHHFANPFHPSSIRAQHEKDQTIIISRSQWYMQVL